MSKETPQSPYSPNDLVRKSYSTLSSWVHAIPVLHKVRIQKMKDEAESDLAIHGPVGSVL